MLVRPQGRHFSTVTSPTRIRVLPHSAQAGHFAASIAVERGSTYTTVQS